MQNLIETRDMLFMSQAEEFLSLGSVQNYELATLRSNEQDLLLSMSLTVDPITQVHMRKSYDVIMLLADIGGIFVTLQILGSIFFSSISTHQQMLLLATELFRLQPESGNDTVRLRVSVCDSIQIYFTRMFESAYCKSKEFKTTFIRKSQRILEKEMDVCNFVKMSRRFKTMYEYDDFMRKVIKEEMRESELKIIDVGAASEDEQGETPKTKEGPYSMTPGYGT